MKLSVIISNRNDTVMLSVTIRSCMETLRPLYPNYEIIVVDNSDLKQYNLLPSVLPTKYIKDRIIKIYRQDFPCLFTARELAAKKASSPYIICLDSHCLCGYNSLLDLYSFMERKKDDDTIAFAHAPVNWLHHHDSNARHDRDMSEDELGNWNKAYNYERTITWKGMPWICRKSWFLDSENGLGAYGALADHRVSWGGGDMHIGIKPWLLGFKNWAVPTSPIHHIGPFPKIDQGSDLNTTSLGKYRLYADSGNYPHTFGFLLSCFILGGESMIDRNKDKITARFGRYIDVKKWKSKAIELGQEERQWLLKRQVISFEQLLKTKPWSPFKN